MKLRRHFESIDGVAYSAAMARPGFSIPWARFFWQGDLAPFYAQMSLVSGVSEGATVVDCPCGAGVSIPSIQRRPDVRYIAIDNSPAMLRRAVRVAERVGAANVDCVLGDAAELELPDGVAELYLSNWGLHCFDRPITALHEAHRVLAPGGKLRGCCFVTGDDSLMQRRMVRPGVSVFREVGSREEIASWIEDAGFEPPMLDQSGPMLYFEARKPGN